jgi:hypothetical protein
MDYGRKYLTSHSMIPLFVIASVFLIASVDAVYAQPLDDVTATILESGDSGTTVQLAWNHDDTVTDYEIGCVSCMPNFSQNTVNDEIILFNVTSLENGKGIFYVIAHDGNGEVIVVKQVLLKLR